MMSSSGSRSVKWCTLYQLAAVAVLLLLAREGLVAQAQRNLSELQPPVGYSVVLSTVSRDAFRTYRCLEGKWALIRSFALLLDASNSSAVVGNYTYSYNDTSSNITGLWAIRRSTEDSVESGQLDSLFSGTVVSEVNNTDPDNLDFQLVQIDVRKSLTVTVMGAFSYVLANGTGGAAPPGVCTDSQTVTVDFVARYVFYAQDVVPPPAALLHGVAASDRELPLQSLFCSGYTNWTMGADGQWDFKSGQGVLTDIPGGTLLGRFTIAPGSSFTWDLDNPYGWTLTADSVRTASVGTRDFPWSLCVVREFRGASIPGRRTFVNFISTRGGLPPPATAAVPAGAEVGVRCSGVSWFYTTTGGASS